jgi:hypothetical protein
MAKHKVKKTVNFKKRRGGDTQQELYDGAATFGRFMGWVKLIIGNIIGFICIGVGIMFIRNPPQQIPSESDLSGSQSPLSQDTTVGRNLGIFVLVFGIIILLITWIYWYVIQTYKVAAAASGVVDVVDIGANAFEN